MTYLLENAPRNSAAGKMFRARLQVLRRIIGTNIKSVRKGQDMDTKTLSKRTGIRIRKLEYWQAGRMEITLAGITRIAAALDVPVSRLLRTRYAAMSGEEETERDGAKTEDSGDNPAKETLGPDETHPNEPDADDSDSDDPERKEEEFDIRDSFETQLDKAVAARERRKPMGFPDRNAIFMMEEPMNRVMGAAALFYDYATALQSRHAEEVPAIGLVFLSQAIRREADRAYRLYFGHPHDG